MTRPPPLDPDSAVFLDVDGTLLDIAPRPELVRIPLKLPGLLERLARQRDGALAPISGRPLADLDGVFQAWGGAGGGLPRGRARARRRHPDREPPQPRRSRRRRGTRPAAAGSHGMR